MLHVCLQCTRKSRLNNRTKDLSKKTPSTLNTSRLSTTMMLVTTFCLSCTCILLRLEFTKNDEQHKFSPSQLMAELHRIKREKTRLDIAKIIQVPSATASGHVRSELCPPSWSWDNWALAYEHKKLLYNQHHLSSETSLQPNPAVIIITQSIEDISS